MLVDDVACVVGTVCCFGVVLLGYLVYVPSVYPSCSRVVPLGFYRLVDGPGYIFVELDQVNNGPYISVGYPHEGHRGAPRRNTVHPLDGSSPDVLLNYLFCGSMVGVGAKCLGRASSDSPNNGFRRTTSPIGLCPTIEWAEVGTCRSYYGFYLPCYWSTL